MTKTAPNSIAVNKKALHDFEVLEKFEAGLVLSGPEVKSVKAGNVNIRPGYVSIQNDQATLRNVHISPYQQADQRDYDPVRARQLLLHKKEIANLESQLNTQGLTVVPLGLHLHKGKIKVSIGLCRGKKLHDKRQDLKKKSQDLEIRKSLKRY